jgi:hypothetical protein
MTVAASILLAALVGGVVFVLLDSWQRRAEATPAAAPPPEPQPAWTPEPRTEPLWTPPPPRWDDRDDDPPQQGLWSGWSR